MESRLPLIGDALPEIRLMADAAFAPAVSIASQLIEQRIAHA
jgi:hypothetical protein